MAQFSCRKSLPTHKLNTTVYHLRTDGLVQSYIDECARKKLLNKVVKIGIIVLYASAQSSILRFSCSMVKKTPCCPVLEPGSAERESFDIDDYKSCLSVYISDAWDLANRRKNSRRVHMTVRPGLKLSYQVNEFLFSCQVPSKGRRTSLPRPFMVPTLQSILVCSSVTDWTTERLADTSCESWIVIS